MTRHGWMAIPALLLLAGCNASAQHEAAVRQVLTIVAEPEGAKASSFVGVVAPQVSVQQSFRIGGTLLTRTVEIGNQVKAGQPMATLDATSYALALETAQANLLTAQAQSANADDAERRLRGLNQTDVVSASNLEQAVQQAAATDAALAQAQARLTQAKEQLGYATLTASIDGVVTAVGAEPGAVVSPGQAIVTVAQPEARDVVIDVPQDIAALLKSGDRFEVSPQLAPGQVVDGTVREVAPQADPVTRTWRIKIGLTNPSSHFWLGTTATARRTGGIAGEIRVPLAAIVEEAAGASLFVVTGSDGSHKVEKRAVTTGPAADGDVTVLTGLSGGERVVVAGAKSLSDGQAVRL